MIWCVFTITNYVMKLYEDVGGYSAKMSMLTGDYIKTFLATQ